MNKVTRRQALLGSIPTTLVLVLALVAAAVGPTALSPDLALVKDHDEVAADAEPTRIMPLGDSITVGVGRPNPGSRVGYRLPLEDLLDGGAYHFDFVGPVLEGAGTLNDRNHAGYPGAKIIDTGDNPNGIDNRVQGGLITSEDPDVVLLMIGTNDMDSEASANGALTRLGTLIDHITGSPSSPAVLVAAIPPRTTDPRSSSPTQVQIESARAANTRTNTYNAGIPAVVNARQGNDVYFVNPSLAASDIYDGTHPNNTGYQKIANAWFRVLDDILPGSGSGPTTSTSSTSTSTSTTVRPISTTVPSGATCPDGKAINAKSGQCSDGSQPTGGTTTTTRPVTTTTARPTSTTSSPTTTTTVNSGATCPDGKAINAKSGQCSDGSQPT